jgi:hypothetical protein
LVSWVFVGVASGGPTGGSAIGLGLDPARYTNHNFISQWYQPPAVFRPLVPLGISSFGSFHPSVIDIVRPETGATAHTL